jgi:hypothetical protein
MSAVNDKIAVYKMIFYNKDPKYEEKFMIRQKFLEKAMRKEQ